MSCQTPKHIRALLKRNMTEWIHKLCDSVSPSAQIPCNHCPNKLQTRTPCVVYQGFSPNSLSHRTWHHITIAGPHCGIFASMVDRCKCMDCIGPCSDWARCDGDGKGKFSNQQHIQHTDTEHLQCPDEVRSRKSEERRPIQKRGYVQKHLRYSMLACSVPHCAELEESGERLLASRLAVSDCGSEHP